MINYLKDVLGEFRSITWLPWNQLVRTTIIVILVSVGISLFLFLNDVVFSKLIFTIIQP